ncbi:MAG: hypothetical protein ACRCT8_06335 [Lacipirellulaceae bacterium]
MSRDQTIRRRLVSNLLVGSAALSATSLSLVQASIGAEAAPAAASDASMVDSPWFNVGWPKVEMPKMNWKPAWMKGDGDAMTADKNPVSKALDKVADTSKQAADKVRGAWGAAVEKLTPGGGAPSQGVASNNAQPGFWSKMFGAPPDPKPQGSETVQEFLAQERPGTVR